jgi:hypothetical protein
LIMQREGKRSSIEEVYKPCPHLMYYEFPCSPYFSYPSIFPTRTSGARRVYISPLPSLLSSFFHHTLHQ